MNTGLPVSSSKDTDVVKVIEGVFTSEQKTQIAERLTDALASVEGEYARRHLVRHRRGQQRRLGDRRAVPDHRGRTCAGRRPTRLRAAATAPIERLPSRYRVRCEAAVDFSRRGAIAVRE